MPMNIKPMDIPGTTRKFVPGIPPLDTHFVEITGEIHETLILKQYPEWDQEVVTNGMDTLDFWKTEQNKNDLQHYFVQPHELVESGKIAEIRYLKVEVVGSRLGEMDGRSLMQGGYMVIKNGLTGDEIFRDKLEYLTGGRQFKVQPDFVFAPGPSVFFGDGTYTDLRELFKPMAFKGGSTFYPKIYWPGNVGLTADKTLEFRVEILELAPLIFLVDAEKVKGAA